MIIEELIEIARRGSEEPLDFWLDHYQRAAPQIVSDLSAVASTLESDTAIAAQLQSCINLFKTSNPDEFELAKSLSSIATVFAQSSPDQGDGAVGKFLGSVRLFYGRAQTAALFTNGREQLKATLPLDQQQAFDLRLFQNEGMTYCLAFHLALYKAIQDVPGEEQKRQLIDGKEINLGFGGLPGLKLDFEQDEVLTKFILKILNDDLRSGLLKAYYEAKVSIVEQVSVTEVIHAFRQWLTALIAAFQKIGIDRFISDFFKPYGDNPRFVEISL